jgi:hypothetical protein
LSDFRLDQGEQFHSVYDYIADWQYKIHFEFEAILPLDLRRFSKPRWQLKAGPYGRNRSRRHHADTVDITIRGLPGRIASQGTNQVYLRIPTRQRSVRGLSSWSLRTQKTALK